MSIEESVKNIEAQLTDYLAQEEKVKSAISFLDNQRTVKDLELNDLKSELESFETQSRLKTTAIVKITTELSEKHAKIKKEVDDLVEKRGTLLVENTRLGKENEDFRAYEAKALKVMNNQSEVLDKREFAIREKEQLLSNKMSFVRPRE